jgi:hypothetical protein
MLPAFVRVVICVIFVLVVGVPASASAVTLSYDYSGTGSVGFQSDATLDIGVPAHLHA